MTSAAKGGEQFPFLHVSADQVQPWSRLYVASALQPLAMQLTTFKVFPEVVVDRYG